MGRLREIIKAIVINPRSRDSVKAATKANTQKRAVDTFFSQMEQFQNFRAKERASIKAEDEEKETAVQDAIAGVLAAQEEDRLADMGFHPDSTPSERMTMRAMGLVSHHLLPALTAKLTSKNTTPNSVGGTLEEIADTSPVGSPFVPSQEIGPVAQRQQKTESGKPASLDRLRLILEQLGVSEEQLAMMGIDINKIDPAKMTMEWMMRVAELIKELQE